MSHTFVVCIPTGIIFYLFGQWNPPHCSFDVSDKIAGPDDIPLAVSLCDR